MKLPTRIAVTSTTAITGLMVLSTEAHMSHVAHKLCLITGGAILGLLVHPREGGTVVPAASSGAGEEPPAVPASILESEPL